MKARENKELTFTVETAKRAGEILTDYHGSNLKHKIKSHPEDIVTEADEKAEKLIIDTIKENYPDDDIIAEESGKIGSGQADYTWLIDPLDGTWNFSQGSYNFGVMIARSNREQVELSVVWCPLLDVLAVAEYGKGTTLNHKKIKIKQITSPKKLKEAMDKTKPGRDIKSLKQLRLVLEKQKITSNYRSAAVNMVKTLQGQSDVRVSTPPGKIWDHVPVSLLLSEAGLKITNHVGSDYKWHRDTNGFIAALPQHHETIMNRMVS